MKRFACALFLGLLFCVPGEANVLQRVPYRPFQDLHAPPEAVGSVLGGPGIALADSVKAKVEYVYQDGGCGSPGSNYGLNPSAAIPEQTKTLLWASLAFGVFSVSLVGYWFFNRRKS